MLAAHADGVRPILLKHLAHGGGVDVLAECVAALGCDPIQRATVVVNQLAIKVGREVALARAPLDFGWENAFHRAAKDRTVPPVAEFLSGRQGEAKFNQAAIEKWIACL